MESPTTDIVSTNDNNLMHCWDKLSNSYHEQINNVVIMLGTKSTKWQWGSQMHKILKLWKQGDNRGYQS